MDEAEWRVATEEIRRVFGQRMTPSDSSELVDVLLPVGRTGIELLLGVDESHVPSEQRDAMRSLQDAITDRVDGTHEVAGVFISAEPLPIQMLAKALQRMGGNPVIPLTLKQAQLLCSLEVDLFDVLEPIHELVDVAASRPEDDLINAAGGLLANIATLIERYDASAD